MQASPAPPPFPKTQFAVQLIGPGKLKLNRQKEVFTPGPQQIVAKIEAVCLCFSDLKLLKQFSAHPRKSDVVSGLSKDVLREIPSYVPNEKPTVPGHEVACRIVAVGSKVKYHKVGERCLVQTDYRDLRTAGSNAAFGYNFEGGLQEYVLIDERVTMDPSSGERFLIPVTDKLAASAVALVEPWACVEESYVYLERRTVKPGGKLLVVADPGCAIEGLTRCFAKAKPASLTIICSEEGQRKTLNSLKVPTAEVTDVSAVPNESFDDIVYYGTQKVTLEALNDKLGTCGIINIVLGNKQIGAPVSVGVGRVHYGTTRWIGTPGNNAADSYRTIPECGELRKGDKVIVVGAGGPMGQMHVIRAVCSGMADVNVTAADVDDARLRSLLTKAEPLAKSNGVKLRAVNTKKQPLSEQFSYIALMAPVGALVADAIRDGQDKCLINIFAGIPAPTRQDLDLDAYIANRCFMFGTSGSTIRDMKIVLAKIEKGQLDTNCSVDAICGMAGAIDGTAAVENRTLAGKIVIYPVLHDLGLVPLTELPKRLPNVAAKLRDGMWSKAAEEELLK
jgi:D-arabinose 1-dehydrogenase-like Zn-dependent alcohol dehydrogenase